MPANYSIGSRCEAFVREFAKLATLREDVRKGVHSGPSIPADDVFDRLEKRYAAESRK